MSEGTGDTRAERRAAQREQRRQELLDAAIELVRREGPFVSMEQIASECGITKPIIYRHFGDRDGLIEEIALRFVDQLARELAPLSNVEGPARAQLLATMDGYLRLIERDTNLYRFLSDHVGDKRDLVVRLIAEEVAVALERRLRRDGLPVDGARPWAYGLVGMVHVAGDWWSEEKRIPRSQLVDQLMLLAWDGMGSLGLDDETSPPPERASRTSKTKPGVTKTGVTKAAATKTATTKNDRTSKTTTRKQSTR